MSAPPYHSVELDRKTTMLTSHTFFFFDAECLMGSYESTYVPFPFHLLFFPSPPSRSSFSFSATPLALAHATELSFTHRPSKAPESPRKLTIGLLLTYSWNALNGCVPFPPPCPYFHSCVANFSFFLPPSNPTDPPSPPPPYLPSPIQQILVHVPLPPLLYRPFPLACITIHHPLFR